MRYTDLQLATSLSKKWENENDLLEMEEFEYQEREVDRNSRGFVRWMQESLNKVLGLRLTVDGNLGPATRSAIRSFQQKQGLSVDGSAGAKTEAAIKAALQGFQIPPQAEPLNTALQYIHLQLSKAFSEPYMGGVPTRKECRTFLLINKPFSKVWAMQSSPVTNRESSQ